MKSVAGALILCLLAVPLASQDPSPAATARTTLETLALKGDPKALAQGIGRRGGDWFDVVLSVVTDPMPPLDGTKALLAALPEPEQKGIGPILDALAAAPATTRQNFAAALGALGGVLRTFAEARGDTKAVTEAAKLAEERVKAANHEWLNARVAVASAFGAFETGIGALDAPLAAAAEKLTAAGDRYDAAFALLLYAKALADKGELEPALVARDRAQAAFKALGSVEKGGPLMRAALARIDITLAIPLYEDARDDAALEACTRARAAFKNTDPSRELEAAAIEAAILIDRGNPAAAVEATKAHVARIPTIKDKQVLTRFTVAATTALRLTGKAPAGLEILRRAVGRAKELGMTPNEESPLRQAMALTYIQSQQYEAAHSALEVVARFAEEPSLRPLAKAAVLSRAILYITQGRAEELPKTLERAAAISLGGPTLDRIANAGPELSIADKLIEQGKPKDALKYIRNAAAVAEELGVRVDDVRIATTTVAMAGTEPLHVRLGIALGGYETGPEWAGFEPVFLVTERRLQEALAGGAPEDAGSPELLTRLKESDRQILKLRRSAAGVRVPVTEEEAKKILAFRKVMVEEAWSRAPAFALRRFPRAGSIKRARDNYCGVDGAIFGASVTDHNAYAFGFSRDRFVFWAVPPSIRIHDAVPALVALAKDPKSTAAAWIAASAPLWEHLITKPLAAFEDKQWVAVCPDPVIDTIPIEALVPGDAKTDNFKTLPYLMQKIAVGRLPTSSLAAEMRQRRNQGWLPNAFAAIVVGEKDKPAAWLPFAQTFDPNVKSETLRSERAGVFKLGETSGDGSESAPAKQPRIMVFGRGIPDSAAGWRGAPPAVVCLLEPPSAKEGSNLMYKWMLRGVRSVIAPRVPMEKPVEDALLLGLLKSFGQEGGNPIEALTVAKRSFLSGTTKVAGLTDAHYHPFHWTPLQAWLVLP